MNRGQGLPYVYIRVLGPLDIRLNEEDSLSFESAKARALLAYLAVEAGRLHSRESLAGLLWPERPDSAALANLRHTLSSLRTTLGERPHGPSRFIPPLIIASANTLQFNSQAGAWVDLIEFENLLAASERPRGEDLQGRIQHLNAAVQLYRSRFMEGFSLKACPEYEDWMLLHREKISLQVQKALRSLAADYEETGALEPALSTLRQLLRIEPWDESAHRQVMTLLAVQGQRSAAIAQYEQCRRILFDELGVEPGEETTSLFEQIRQGKLIRTGKRSPEKTPGRTPWDPDALTLPAVAASLLPKPSHPRFVGRQHQLARLRHSLDLALEGHGQLVFITGEAGSGKTSLAWEFANQAMELHADLLAAAGRCNAMIGFEDPYLPFREILQMLAGIQETHYGHPQTPEHLRRLTSAFPDTIKSLLSCGSELIGSFISREMLVQRLETFGPGQQSLLRDFQQILGPAAVRPASSQGSAGSFKPAEPLICMLVDLSRHRPLILFLDDLQWADAASVSLLHYLCKRLAGSRVLVIGAYRPQDVALGWRDPEGVWERHPLARVCLELKREFGELEMNLDGDPDEGTAFVHALLDTEPNHLPETFRETLYQQTNGNPLFVRELLRDMQTRGDIVQDSDGYWVEGPQLSWGKLPARVEAVIAERIGRLEPHLQAILQAASVEGEAFTAEVVARVLNLKDDQVIHLLSGPLSREQQLVKAVGILRNQENLADKPGRIARYRFSHILFQKYLYNRLDEIERSALHEATGMALEALVGVSVERELELARHYEQAGSYARAAEHLLAAGKAAISLSAHSQAKALYDRCLGLVQKLPDTSGRTHLEIQVQLARGAPLFAIEGWGSPQAVQAVNRAVELLEQSCESCSDPAILVALFLQSDYFLAQNNIPEALARADLLLQHASAGIERPYQVLANLAAGQVYFFSGQPRVASEYLKQTIASYSPDDEALLTSVTGYSVLTASLSWDIWVQWLLGNPTQALSSRDKLIEFAHQQGTSIPLDGVVAITGALLSAIMNEPKAARLYADEGLHQVKPNSPPVGRILCTTVLGWAKAHEGEYAGGFDLLQAGIDEWQKIGALNMLPISLLFKADVLRLTGKSEAAWQLTVKVAGIIQQSGRRVLEAYLLWLQGEILMSEERRRGGPWKLDYSPIASFQEAIRVARQQGARSLELRATTSLARCLQEGGKSEEAYCQLRDIERFFEGEIETRDLREARSLLASLSKKIQTVSES